MTNKKEVNEKKRKENKRQSQQQQQTAVAFYNHIDARVSVRARTTCAFSFHFSQYLFLIFSTLLV